MSEGRERRPIEPHTVWDEFEKGLKFNDGIKLQETVEANENFFIGKQWEGVRDNGLPTPVFNVIKRIVLYQIATTAADNVAMAVTPLTKAYPSPAPELGAAQGFAVPPPDVDMVCQVMGEQFSALFEQCKMGKLLREFMRDAAVRGDGCLYSWFDQDAETGQEAKGTIRVERLENTRVIFGDPNLREVQEQPYIIISRRERVRDVAREARANGQDGESVKGESDQLSDPFDALANDKVTTLTRFEKRDGTVWWSKTTKDAVILPERDTGMRLYPLVWMNWERVNNSYHGQAAVTGLIPNQIFINKAWAMTMISLMTSAFPKVLYDNTVISRWNNRVSEAIGVNTQGRSLNDVAKTIDPSTISPQVSQFIDKAEAMTKELNGATDAALGNVRPDNTSAIIALQKASGVPMELVKQDLYQAIEDLGRVWLDQVRCYYGQRYVELPVGEEERLAAQELGLPVPEGTSPQLFDFSSLGNTPLSLKLDVGGSAYWSEIAQITTLENLLARGDITIVDFLERLPNGYIAKQQELIDTLKERLAAQAQAQASAMPQVPMEGPQTSVGELLAGGLTM